MQFSQLSTPLILWHSLTHFTGKVELSVILCISRENENVLEVIPSEVLEVVNTYQLRPFIAKVSNPSFFLAFL